MQLFSAFSAPHPASSSLGSLEAGAWELACTALAPSSITPLLLFPPPSSCCETHVKGVQPKACQGSAGPGRGCTATLPANIFPRLSLILTHTANKWLHHLSSRSVPNDLNLATHTPVLLNSTFSITQYPVQVFNIFPVFPLTCNPLPELNQYVALKAWESTGNRLHSQDLQLWWPPL